MSGPGGGSLAARAERWLASGLLDVEFYAALRGRRFETPGEASEDFVGHGMGERLSPHPFLDVLSLPPDVRRAFRQGKVNPVLQHLTGPDGRVAPAGPLAAAEQPAAVRDHLVAVAGLLGGGRASDPAATAGAAERVAGRTSVLVLSDDSRSTLRSARSVVRHAGGLDVEVVVVDRGLPPHVALALHGWACSEAGAPTTAASGWSWPSVRGTRLTVLHSADVDAASAHTSGDLLVVLDASCEVRRGWLTGLREVLTDPAVAAVQPLLLQPDDSIAAAGLAESGAPLLAGHPKEDAHHLRGRAVPAISDLAWAARAEDVPGPRSGDLRLAPTSWVSTSTTDVGSGSPAGAELVAPPADGHLRWSIKLPSPPGGFGDAWGDTHYADSFAAALRRLGQDVVTRRRGAHDSGPIHLDDVSLALRGLHPIPPTPGQHNVLWVISHPEDVDPQEFEGYDLVCAASTAWSEEMSVRTGREVVPLLQATEFEATAGASATTGPDATVVFVGTNLGTRERPLVWQAVEAGIPLSVHGPGWEGLPDGVWQGEYVANAELGALYRRHGIVLADHWPDMAERGFIANRVFDAVASGCAVISDEVAGLHDVFDARDVVVARTPQEIRDAVAGLRERRTGPRPLPSGLSFDDRAAALLERVLLL